MEENRAESADRGHIIIFYDGGCALCHGCVKFVLPRDTDGRFRFSPLGGSEIRRHLDDTRRDSLPDSVVLLDPSGGVHTRTDAVVRILRELGGGWKVAGRLLEIVPAPLRDAAYNVVARIRYRLFKPVPDVCPVVPPQFAGRFLD